MTRAASGVAFSVRRLAARVHGSPAGAASSSFLRLRRGALDPTGRTLQERRWWGWLDHASDRALIVHGPYPHPAEAHHAARPMVDEVRLTQLAAPAAMAERSAP